MTGILVGKCRKWTYESRTERTGHQHIQRQVCREVADVADNKRIDGTRRCGFNGISPPHYLQLGIWTDSTASRRISYFGKSPYGEYPKFNAKQLKNEHFLKPEMPPFPKNRNALYYLMPKMRYTEHPLFACVLYVSHFFGEKSKQERFFTYTFRYTESNPIVA